MSQELHEWCQRHVPDMKRLVDGLQQPATTTTSKSVDDLMRILDDIRYSLGPMLDTLLAGSKPSAFGRFLDFIAPLAGSGKSPDYAYYGPAPDLSGYFDGSGIPSVAGTASVAGAVADMGLAGTATYKQHLVIVKEKKQYTKNPTALNADVRNAYCALVETLNALVNNCAKGGGNAATHFGNGFNLPIAKLAWSKAKRYRWCADLS